MTERLWRIVDQRDGKPASVAAYPTREQAERQLDTIHRKFERGIRLDLADVIGDLIVVPR